MRIPAFLLLFALLVGCTPKTPEEEAASKLPPPKMMSDAEARAYEDAHRDPRNGGPVPKEPVKTP